MFEVERRIVFFNGITDTYLLTIEGRCSITDQVNQLEVTCKVGDGEMDLKKHFLGLSDNVNYFVEQTVSTQPSVYNYRVIFKRMDERVCGSRYYIPAAARYAWGFFTIPHLRIRLPGYLAAMCPGVCLNPVSLS